MSAIPHAFRRAEVDDAPEVARLATELGYPIDLGEMRARLARVLPDPAHYVAVAAGESGNLLGWVHAEQRFSLEVGARAELMGLVVDSSVQREGIGGSLVRLAESWASQRGLGKITVRSNIARTSSHPFYQARGYMREKSQNVYVKALPSESNGADG